MTPHVAILLKAPIAGTVKTRIAQTAGPATALVIYRQLVTHQLGQIPPGWPITVHYAPATPNAEAAMANWLGPRPTYLPQPDGDLGARLTHAATTHFATSANPLLLIGGDCPYLTHGKLTEAAHSLANHAACLIPAIDGGYCLLGLRQLIPEVFRDIAWSTATVLDQTLDRLHSNNVSPAVITPPLEDIDHLDAWQRALASGTIQIPGSAVATSTTPPPTSDATP